MADDFAGQANHAGTTRLEDRHDAMLPFARAVLAARESAARHLSVATVGRVTVVPNGVNAIASQVVASLDVRGPDPDEVRSVVAELSALVEAEGGSLLEQSWTDATPFDASLRGRLSDALGAPPILATGAGHDAGILDRAGIPTAMIFVRNPSGVSHSPAEFAERADCLAGVVALTTALRALSS